MYLDSAVDAILKGLGEQVYSMRINIIDSLISVFLVLILLPEIGIYGYIIVIYITELFNASFSIIRLLNKTKIKPRVLKWIVKPILSIVLATFSYRFAFNYIFSYLLSLGKLSLILEIMMCVVLYILFSKLFGSFSKGESTLIKKCFS